MLPSISCSREQLEKQKNLGSVLWNRDCRCFFTVTGKKIPSFVRAQTSCTARLFLLKSRLVPLLFLLKRSELGRVKEEERPGMGQKGCL